MSGRRRSVKFNARLERVAIGEQEESKEEGALVEEKTNDDDDNKPRRSTRSTSSAVKAATSTTPSMPPPQPSILPTPPQMKDSKVSDTSAPTSRRDQQRQIAERRASHFARVDKSSTPTGSLRRRGGTSGVEANDGESGENAKESWPGPFNTAWQIMEKREAAKKAREEKLKQAKDAVNIVDLESDELDAYDKELHTMSWDPVPWDASAVNSYDQTIPPLSDMCLNLLTKYFDNVQPEAWDVLSPEQRESLGKLLSKERRLLRKEVLALSTVGTSSLLVSDASLIDEDTMILAIEKACGQHGSATKFEAHVAAIEASMPTNTTEATSSKDNSENIKGKKTRGKGKGDKAEKEENTGKGKAKGKASASDKPAASGKKRKAKSMEDDEDDGMMGMEEENDDDNIEDIEIEIENNTFNAAKNEDDEFMIHNENNHLMRLHLRHCGRCFSDRLAAAFVNHAQKLEDLVITGCYKLSDDGLIRILHGCQQTLRRLDVSYDNRLSSRALHVICNELPQLESLSLNHCNHLQDADITELTRIGLLNASSGGGSSRDPLGHLQEISLEGLLDLTDDSVIGIIERFGCQLTSLNLSIMNISDEVLISMRSCCSSLKKIVLNHVDKVSTASLLGLFVKNPHVVEPSSSSSLANNSNDYDHTINGSISIGALESLSFEGVVTVTDDVITQLCENYGKTIKYLNINGCNRLTDRALIAIRFHCPNLEYLDSSFVRDFSEKAMGLLIDNCQELKELRIWGCTQFTKRLFYGHRAKGRLKIVGRISL